MIETELPLETVYIGFGSNMGDRIKNVGRMLSLLGQIEVSHIRCSSLWLSEPLDMVGGSEAFINGAIEMRTLLSPMALLDQLQHIEVIMGRPADHGKNTSRVIDLDIISFGDERIATAELVVPHPRVSERLFVLKPLMELVPALMMPGYRLSVTELAALAPPMALSLFSPQ